jgi:hypothetical protein
MRERYPATSLGVLDFKPVSMMAFSVYAGLRSKALNITEIDCFFAEGLPLM